MAEERQDLEERNEPEAVFEEVRERRPRKVYKGMWGPLEMATVGVSLLFFILVAGGYLLVVLPEVRQLESNRARRDDLDRELREARRKFGNISNTETQVSNLIKSAEDFEATFLLEESIGKTAIYQRLNGLIFAFGLTNSTGPDYTPIEITEDERREGADQQAESGRGRFQSIFPGIYVTMTVEGSYVNLRRFLNEVENSNEYIVISTVELEPSETEEGAAPPAGAVNAVADPEPGGRVRGKVVSLRLELAAYFQRANEKKLLTGGLESAQ